MSKRNDEEMGEILSSLLRRRKQVPDRAACPDEESLATYLSGSISKAARNKLEEHLVGCSFCLTEVAAANEAGEGGATATVPRWLMERAMGLVASGREGSVVRLAVRLVRNAVELVSGAGEWIVPSMPQLVPVRGAAAGAAGIVQVEKEIGGYKIMAELEQVEIGTCQVVITLNSPDGKPADGVRLSLMVGEREQASFLTRQGQAVFAGVPKGEYDLVISQAGTTVGTINLIIEAGS